MGRDTTLRTLPPGSALTRSVCFNQGRQPRSVLTPTYDAIHSAASTRTEMTSLIFLRELLRPSLTPPESRRSPGCSTYMPRFNREAPSPHFARLGMTYGRDGILQTP